MNTQPFIESRCIYLNFRCRACIKQRVPWYSGNHRVSDGHFWESELNFKFPMALIKLNYRGLYYAFWETKKFVFNKDVGSRPNSLTGMFQRFRWKFMDIYLAAHLRIATSMYGIFLFACLFVCLFYCLFLLIFSCVYEKLRNFAIFFVKLLSFKMSFLLKNHILISGLLFFLSNCVI